MFSADEIDSFDADDRDWLSLSSFLRERPDAQSEVVSALIAALDYHPARSSKYSSELGRSFYGPMFELDGKIYPTPLENINNDTLKIWREYFEAADSPILRARLGDLLWLRRYGSRPDQFCRGAIEAFLNVGRRLALSRITRANSIVRAIELARSINDSDRVKTGTSAATEICAESLSQTDPEPGVSLFLIESLIGLPPDLQPDELSGLIESALSKFEADPIAYQTAVDLLISFSQPGVDDLKELGRKKVRSWTDDAMSQEGFTRGMSLKRAVEQARLHGLTEELEQLRVLSQEVDRISEMRTFSSEVNIPNERIETFLSDLITEDLALSIRRFGAYCPISDSPEDSVQAVQVQMQEHPLQFLMTNVVIGPGDFPIMYVSDPETQLKVEVAKYEAMEIAFWGALGAIVLQRMKEVFPLSNDFDLAGLFEGPLISRPAAEVFGTSLRDHWEGRYSQALYPAIAQIEAIIREMCRRIGGVIFVEPQGNKPGRLKLLGDLLEILRGALNRGRRDYLHRLLVDPFGVNLRNRAMHGLLVQITATESALVLHCASMLSGLDLAERGESSSPNKAE